MIGEWFDARFTIQIKWLQLDIFMLLHNRKTVIKRENVLSNFCCAESF